MSARDGHTAAVDARSRFERTHEPHVGARHDERPRQNGAAQDGDLAVFHEIGLPFSLDVPVLASLRPRAPVLASLRPRAVDRDRCDQQRPGEDTRKLGWQHRQVQTILQNRDRKQPEERAPDRAAPAEHRGAAEDDGGDRVELVSRAGVRLGLTEVRHVDDRRDARDEPGQKVDQTHALRNRHARIPRAGRSESDRVPRTPEHRAVQQDGVAGEDQHKNRELRRDDSPQVPLSERQEAAREPAVVGGPVRQPLGDPAEHRHRSQRDDERWEVQPRDQQRVQQSARTADEHRRGRGRRDRQMPISIRPAKRDRREAHHRSDRQIDAAGDDDGRQRQRQQAELDADARDLEEIA